MFRATPRGRSSDNNVADMSLSQESKLKSAISKYKYRDMAYSDIQKVFFHYKDLKPQFENYVFNDGTVKELLKLDGTIPVSFKGATYNIPICMWIVDTHPYNPPIVYVTPTNTMRIRISDNVDANGKIDLPYLHDWQHPRSELVGLIQVLTIVFSENPPVYSNAPARPPYPAGAGGRPPYPMEQPVRSSHSTTHTTPYPTGGGYVAMPMPNPSPVGSNASYQAPYPTSHAPYPTASQPNYPPYPNQTPQVTPYPMPTNQVKPYPTATPQATPYPTSTQSTPYLPQQYPPYPYPNSTVGQLPTVQQQTNVMSGSSTVTEEHIRASLLSAVEEKARRRLKEMFDTAQVEMEVLYKTQRELQTGKDKLETQLKNLASEKANVQQKIEAVKEKDREMKSVLSRMQHQDKIPIDDAVVTPAPLYKQLLNSFAEEQALEDAIYYLGEALRKNIIDLDIFLKHVRELSRKQFMLRALIQKCREKAGLPVLT